MKDPVRDLEQRYGIRLRFVPTATTLIDVVLHVLQQVRPHRRRFRSIVDVHRRGGGCPQGQVQSLAGCGCAHALARPHCVRDTCVSARPVSTTPVCSTGCGTFTHGLRRRRPRAPPKVAPLDCSHYIHPLKRYSH
jgi:hypothetical protein